ncbi:hypothetical protein HN011_003366 [Eciton burchellii]|nr:hypothetical protein HN011_003366 [Eciton burchellii]
MQEEIFRETSALLAHASTASQFRKREAGLLTFADTISGASFRSRYEENERTRRGVRGVKDVLGEMCPDLESSAARLRIASKREERSSIEGLMQIDRYR